MDLINGELRSHLDPTAIRILKKRLVSGKITPRVFKDILRRQMVKYFFKSHQHPLTITLEGWRRRIKKRLGLNGTATPRSRENKRETPHHKRF